MEPSVTKHLGKYLAIIPGSTGTLAIPISKKNYKELIKIGVGQFEMPALEN